MLSNVYAIVKYTILCTGEKKCVNLRNICPSGGVVGFLRFGQRILQGEDKNSEGGGGVALRPPSELCLHIPC